VSHLACSGGCVENGAQMLSTHKLFRGIFLIQLKQEDSNGNLYVTNRPTHLVSLVAQTGLNVILAIRENIDKVLSETTLDMNRDRSA
jgi:hypothetical protein